MDEAIRCVKHRVANDLQVKDGFATAELLCPVQATVEIKTGKRRVIEYFLLLKQHTSESLRER